MFHGRLVDASYITGEFVYLCSTTAALGQMWPRVALNAFVCLIGQYISFGACKLWLTNICHEHDCLCTGNMQTDLASSGNFSNTLLTIWKCFWLECSICSYFILYVLYYHSHLQESWDAAGVFLLVLPLLMPLLVSFLVLLTFIT